MKIQLFLALVGSLYVIFQVGSWLIAAVYLVGSGPGLLASLVILGGMVIAGYETARYFVLKIWRR
ncbi:hypothetical protein FD25_GL002182 [Levilactobacillus acidifarinae DSM 19394]|uniref:Uncharacterized protein n=1 Tax=Levilactobacillus acidifarinae DSM 19394 = JCM 15949 TaxID=1423715 RepID=A0A0R1LH39_9LACO|nr:hypothetical protein FD25_GL002182 [Levilactobacillus acidifarinae DSM 19394]